MIDLWIDTDMGGDIDDALTLAMALQDERICLAGISTVYIANQWRTDLVRKMVHTFGKRTPVYAGSERSLCGSWGKEDCLERNDAADALAAAACCHPMHLLAIGPLTNVALALLQKPDIAANLTIFLMGGMVSCAFPEWNIQCDPEAAQIVFQSGAEITMVGLDVTEQCRLTDDEATSLVCCNDSRMRFLQEELRRYREHFSFTPILHDPLTLLTLLEEDICEYQQMDIQVETRGILTRGVTVNCRHSENKPIRVAVRVDAKSAIQRICQMVRGNSPS